MSDAVAVRAIGTEHEAGHNPRQDGFLPLSTAQGVRVLSRTMQGLELVKRIEQRLDELRLSAQAASLRVSDNRDLIRGVLRQGADANPRIETVQLIARALELDAEELTRTAAGQPDSRRPPRGPSEFVEAGVRVPSAAEMPRNVPVMGTALGSLVDDKFEGFHLEGSPVDYVRRPPGLAHVPDAYAIYVQNDSMYPMHPPGDLRFVNPHKPPRAGGTVVVQTRHWESDPGQGYIKIFRRRTSTVVVLEQLNPPATIEIPLKYVVSIHHVPDMAELFGV